MKPNTSNGSAQNSRPAQVFLTPDDRGLLNDLRRRSSSRGVRVKGPTPVFRAGMKALRRLSDDELAALFAEVTEKRSYDMIRELFTIWCGDVDKRVCRAAESNGPADLEYAWGARHGGDDVGNFRFQNRFVHMNVMHDGRVLISGLEAQVTPMRAGAPMPRAQQLFPGGLATMLSMNKEGADLAARAVVSWLTCDKDQVQAVRGDIRRHRADPLD